MISLHPPLLAVALGAAALSASCTARQQAANGDTLMARGDSLYARQEFDSAAAFWRTSLTVTGVRGTAAEARLLTKLGNAAWRRTDYATARRLGDSALSLKRALGMSDGELAESENALGLVAWDEGRLEDANGLYAEARAGFLAVGNREGLAKVYGNIALVAIEFGRFSDARRALDTARAFAHLVGDPRLEGRAATNLGIVETQAGDPRVALQDFADARRLAALVRDDVNLENALGQLGVTWELLGDPGRAIASVDSALEVARRHGLLEEETNDLLLLASIYRDAGDLDRALQNYERGRALSDSAGLKEEQGIALREMAALRVARGSREEARPDLSEALRLHHEAGASLQEFNDLLALASLELEGGTRAAAGRWIAAATERAADLDAPQARSDLALVRSRLALDEGNPERALRLLDAVSGQIALGAGQAAVESEWLRTRAFAALGRLDSAVAAGRRAIRTIERSRNTLASPALRTSFTADRSAVFGDLVLALLRIGQVDEAFAVADAARGRVLLDYLAGAESGIRRSMVQRDFAERQRLLREIDALVAKLQEVRSRPRRERGPDDSVQGTELERRLAAARAQYEALLIRLAETDPTRSGLAGARAASAGTVRAALQRDEALLEYLATPDQLILFVVRHDTTYALRHPVSSADLENRVRLARALMATPDARARATPALTALYTELVSPAEQNGWFRGIRHLIVIPHGVLSYLPFAGLVDARTGRALVDDYSVENLPSAEALPLLRASPVVAARSVQTTIFAPFPNQLRATAAEAAAVAQTVANSRTVTGGGATEAALRQALSDGGIVHVATHGVMTPANPLFSSIQLAPGRTRSGSSEDDGRLEVHELLGLTSASPLVFLSGCETALGGARATLFARSEDYATLAQAFLFTGVRGVVATLWRIDDEGAAEFAQRFYVHLASHSAADALAAAQRDLRADPRWASPYYWAAYTLVGDGPPAALSQTAVSVKR